MVKNGIKGMTHRKPVNRTQNILTIKFYIFSKNQELEIYTKSND